MKCPYNLQFGKDHDEFESCEECADENNSTYEACGLAYNEMNDDLG
jgi:hypothetical protein